MTKHVDVLVAVDGNSLAHRAFHAGGGRPERARPLFYSLLAKVERQVNCDLRMTHAVVGFDDASSSLRRSEFEPYKAQRAEKPPVLVELLRCLADSLRSQGVYVVIPAGLEADDVLASAAQLAAAEGTRSVLVTSDRDALAHVGAAVSVLVPTDPPRWIGCDAVRENYGVTPERYLLLAALRGDPSDNLPGVAGVGPTKAARLAARFASLDQLRSAHVDDVAAIVGRSTAAKLLGDGALDVVERNLSVMSPRLVALDLASARCAGFYGLQ